MDRSDYQKNRSVSIALACRTFSVSESGYRYERQLSDENAEIAKWLVKLTSNRRTWGFVLCFLYLRNVKGFCWNHKRVYRIYCALELNLRIRPKMRLKRDKPDALAVPDAANPIKNGGITASKIFRFSTGAR